MDGGNTQKERESVCCVPLYILITNLLYNYRDTYLEKLKDETPNDRNDRGILIKGGWTECFFLANGVLYLYINPLLLLLSLLLAIRVATQWYSNHLKSHGIETLMLSDDRANREKASATGIRSSSGIYI